MRRKNTILNFITAYIPFIILAVLGFVRLKFFLSYLGEEIYALNQLFFQIFAYLSLLDAGIGSYITQKYYRHFAVDDKKSIREIHNESKYVLKRMTYLMLGIGVVVSISLPLLSNNNLSNWFMQLVFILFLVRNLVDYYMFSPRFVIDGNQQLHRINLITNGFRILEIIIEIILLLTGFDYVVLLLGSIFMRIVTNLVANKKIYSIYPWLKSKEETKQIKSIKISEIKNVMAYKFSGALYNNVDILLISTFLNPLTVVIYSSYNYVKKFITDSIYMLSSSTTASFGNLLNKENTSENLKIFEEVNSLFLYLGMFLSLMFYFIIDDFITLWIGTKYLVTENILIVFSLLLFYSIIRRPFLTMVYATGSYRETKKIAYAEGILNLILSLILIQKYKIVGVLMATLISSFFTTLIFLPKYIYEKVFKKSAISYYVKLCVVLIITVIMALIYRMNFNSVNISGWGNWLIYYFSVGVVLLIVTFIINYFISPYFRKFIFKTWYAIGKGVKKND